MLDVSLPHLLKLLDAGEILFRMAGTHRRIGVAALNAYKVKSRQERRTAIDTMVAVCQELNLD